MRKLQIDELHLTLKKKWFNMILSGEKKEEYREDKTYWRARFTEPGSHPPVLIKSPKRIVFTNGYGHHRPQITIECLGLGLNFSRHPEWGGDTKNLQFILRLGEILETKNV